MPNPEFPFLGVHFTKSIHGGVEAGPNAVLAMAREGYTKLRFNAQESAWTLTYPGFWQMARKYWKTGMHEVYRSFSKKAFAQALQRLVPAIREDDLDGGRRRRARPGGRQDGAADRRLPHRRRAERGARAERAFARRHGIVVDQRRHPGDGAEERSSSGTDAAQSRDLSN